MLFSGRLGQIAQVGFQKHESESNFIMLSKTNLGCSFQIALKLAIFCTYTKLNFVKLFWKVLEDCRKILGSFPKKGGELNKCVSCEK